MILVSFDLSASGLESHFEFDIENELFLSQMSADYKHYYDMITSIILGEYEFGTDSEDEIFLVR